MDHLKQTSLLTTYICVIVCVLFSKNVELCAAKAAREPIPKYNLSVTTQTNHGSISQRFLSVTIDTSKVQANWQGIDFSSLKLQNLGKALDPIDYRFGGTQADHLTFSVNGGEKADPDFIMTGKQYDEMISYVKKVGWDLIFDFNVFHRTHEVWDTSNAELFLNYSSSKGVAIPFFQLGNEPDQYKTTVVSPSALAADFKTLKNLLAKYPLYKNSLIYGPGVTNLGHNSASTHYLQQFIQAGGADTVAEIGIHQYYMNGAIAKLQDFLSVAVLDNLKSLLEIANNVSKTASHPIRVRLSETSSCYGGGAPTLSNTFVAGFLWLDKLGVSSQYGLTRVFRQDFIGGSYELVAANSFNPNPDYYLSLLFKRLVEGSVFSVSISPPQKQLRVYANCARKDFYNYPAGAIVVYFLNLADEQAQLSLPHFSGDVQDVFLLTPGDDKGLTSRLVKLNGQVLQMSGNNVPQLSPNQHTGDLTVAAHSFGFIVIPKANVQACGGTK